MGNHTGLLSVSGIITGEEAHLRTRQKIRSRTISRDPWVETVAAVHTLTYTWHDPWPSSETPRASKTAVACKQTSTGNEFWNVRTLTLIKFSGKRMEMSKVDAIKQADPDLLISRIQAANVWGILCQLSSLLATCHERFLLCATAKWDLTSVCFRKVQIN